MHDDAVTPDELFAGFPETLVIYRSVQDAVATIGDATIRVSKSQIAFRRRRGFAYVWRPGQYINSEVPAVLSIALPHESPSDRFKEVVHPSANIWMHHLELHEATEVDHQVAAWLAEAYASAH
ncbi:DUF5655 domain-containing protein [Ornithinimicrobium sufpigmenti]|uniref:DUF5655 domain-containing protein n=1 Tax=Ornithinimicrobium sufpigmenti TaxID=2508882 RepID=UPI0010369282|nr:MULTISPECIES: DUF5655 domain-containing protein [unclassified Ornithinimicrobium]